MENITKRTIYIYICVCVCVCVCLCVSSTYSQIKIKPTIENIFKGKHLPFAGIIWSSPYSPR